MGYYNTTGETGDKLKEYRQKAESQEEIILAFFVRYPTKAFSPFAVQKYLRANWPITSVRRAITNLTSDGKLEKLEVKKAERYGRPNHLWRLADKTQVHLL